MYLPQSDDDGRSLDLKARHGVTDCFCCALFVLASCVTFLLYLWSLSHGNVARLYHGTDYRGNICGVSTAVSNAPFLYWCPSSSGPDGLRLRMHRPICVSSCPGPEVPGLLAPVSKVEPDCAHFGNAEGIVGYRTRLARGRYCLPDRKEYPEMRRRIIDVHLAGRADNLMETIASVPQAMHVLVAAFFVSVVLGYLYLALLRSCSEAMIRLSLMLSIVGLALLGCALWSASSNASGTAPSIAVLGHAGGHGEATLLQGFALLAWFFVGVVSCAACSLQTNAPRAAACLEVTCEAVLEMRCSLLLAPALRAFCEAALAPVLLHGLLLLLSCVEANSGSSFIRIWEVAVPQALIIPFYAISSLWLIGWVHALYQFMVAYAVAEYYYTPYDMDDEKDVGCCTVWDGLFIGLLYHSGSLAFGSLLITLLKPFRWLAWCAGFSFREASATGNEAIACMFCCCARTARFWKATLGFVNKNAYIDMVITSRSFCDSARNAQQMIVSLGGSVAALNGATDLLATFGTATIVLATAYVISARGALTDDASTFRVNDPVAAMVVSMLVALRVASCFMSIFDVASDTLLYCYGIDLQSGKGSHTAPEALKQLVHAHEDEYE